MREKGHPVVERWKEMEEEEEEVERIEVAEMPVTIEGVPLKTIPVAGSGFRIILKNVKIKAKKVIIKKGEKVARKKRKR
ncbi:MAG TPA: hypothetical protein ENF80_04540 [Thermofilum sp.]|nr:hypothetical protein [Thermofilum sp.]